MFRHMYNENKDLQKEFERYGLNDDECKIIIGLMEGSETKVMYLSDLYSMEIPIKCNVFTQMPKLEGKSFLYEVNQTYIPVDICTNSYNKLSFLP